MPHDTSSYYSLGGGHMCTHTYTYTHTYMHTNDPHIINFKKPGTGRHAPGSKILMM